MIPKRRFAFGLYHDRLWAWLRRDTYALPLDVFRVLGGLLLLAYFVSLLLQTEDFTNPDGLIDHVLVQQIFWFTRLSLFHPGLGLPFFYAVFGLACLGACGIVLGYRVKLWAAVLYGIAVSTYRWNFFVIYVDDAIMHLLLFWFLLLPVGRTLTLSDLLRQPRGCLARWCAVTVAGATLRCFLANVCLVYLVAGLWKFESPLWRAGFAVYATLRLPIAYAPDFWGPQHLPLLMVVNHLTLLIEPLLPVLLLLRRGHPLKWLGLVGQMGFHLGIILTLRVPFANLALMATAVLFFREDIMRGLLRRQTENLTLGEAPRLDRAGRLALAFVLVLSLAMMRRLPVIGIVHKPAYALLWTVGIAQDYQLFNWIDRKNYYAKHRVVESRAGEPPRSLEPTTIFPISLRAVLLQSYLHNVRWMPLPRKNRRQYRRALKHSILTRLAQRFCRTQSPQGPVTVETTVQRIRPKNATLAQGRDRFLMTFQCSEGSAILCRTMLDPTRATDCQTPAVSAQPAAHRR